MIRFTKYSKLLSRIGATTLMCTALLVGVVFQPKPASAQITSVLPGTIPNTVVLKLSPYKQTNKFRYIMQGTPLGVIPVLGKLVTNYAPGALTYTLGSNIQYNALNPILDVYEVDESGKIAAFKEFQSITKYIAAPVVNVNAISAGTVTGSTKLTLVQAYGGTFKIQIGTKATSQLPAIGSVAKGSAYISGSDITGVDAVKNRYIDIYEVDLNGNTLAFKEVILKPSMVAVPDIKSASANAGTTAGSTILKLTPAKAGDQFYYISSSSSLSLSWAWFGMPVPAIGTDGSFLAASANQYTTGMELSLNLANPYLDVYEVDDTMSIVAFKEFQLTTSNQAAPTSINAAIAIPGTLAGSTKLILTPNIIGDTFKVLASSKASTILPATGSVAKGAAYTSGNDLIGVDAVKNKYIDMYEIDNTGKTVAFTEMVLDISNLAAPDLKSPSALPGSIALSTKLKLSPTKTGNSFKYVWPAVGSRPVLGNPVPGGALAYSSGNDIFLGFSIATAFEVYEVDSSGKIVAYSVVTVNPSAISAPSIAITSIANAIPGIVAGSTSLTLLPAVSAPGNSYKVLVSNKPVTTLPALGDASKGSPYPLGTSIPGVDPIKNKYLDIYEVDVNGKTVKFIELMLDSSNMTAPDLN